LAKETSRTAVVTGGSAGIGLEIARGLQAQGYRTTLAVRDRGRGEAAARDIASTTGGRAPEVLEVDLSIPGSIRAFAAEFARRHATLDVLVNNAATWSTARKETREGRELVWSTNQLGYYLTTELLLPRLRAAPSARIVNVASELAHGLDLLDVEFKTRSYSGVLAYAQSKQANRMWTRAVARRLRGTKITINSMHPGGVATDLMAKGGGMVAKVLGAVSRSVGRSPAEGADTAIWLATSPEVAGRTGLFYMDRAERLCRFVNEAEEEKLFALCAAQTDG
jgi:NAD(P)-dependent dehydrogenase (short-subunit alcohol dehydrogenase family)